MPKRKLSAYQKLVREKAKEGYHGAALFHAAAAAHRHGGHMDGTRHHGHHRKSHHRMSHHGLEHMHPGYVRVAHQQHY